MSESRGLASACTCSSWDQAPALTRSHTQEPAQRRPACSADACSVAPCGRMMQSALSVAGTAAGIAQADYTSRHQCISTLLWAACSKWHAGSMYQSLLLAVGQIWHWLQGKARWQDTGHQRRAVSKAWLSFLALPLTPSLLHQVCPPCSCVLVACDVGRMQGCRTARMQ